MSFTVTCPECGKQTKAAPEEIGLPMKCPECGREFEIENPNLVPCPDCFEPVSKRAAVCPHCGAPLEPPEPQTVVRTIESGDFESVKNEKVIIFCHPSLRNYLGTIALGLLTFVVLFGIYLLLKVWFDTLLTRYRITNLRIVVTKGWIAKTQNEIWIKDMRGANLVQDAWQRIIGVGDISIGTAATAEAEIRLVGIRRPQAVVNQINALRH